MQTKWRSPAISVCSFRYCNETDVYGRESNRLLGCQNQMNWQLFTYTSSGHVDKVLSKCVKWTWNLNCAWTYHIKLLRSILYILQVQTKNYDVGAFKIKIVIFYVFKVILPVNRKLNLQRKNIYSIFVFRAYLSAINS